MIVKELIEALQKCPQGCEVCYGDESVDYVALMEYKNLIGEYFSGDESRVELR